MKRKQYGGIRKTHELKGAEPPAVRKGFVQVIEVAIAALLIVLVLPVFFGWLNVKQDWARHDLAASGTGIIRSLEVGGNMSQIFNNTQEVIREIEAIKPANVKYSIYAEGVPKPRILMACACSDAQLSYAKSIFTPALFNGEIVNFTIEKIDLGALPSIPGNYDVAVFINYADSDWTANRQKVSDYLKSGKGIIAIQPASSGADFMNTFNLSNAGGSASYQNFTSYIPAGTNIEKYFLGFGFDVSTADDGTGTYRGIWNIWDNQKRINTTGTKVGLEDYGIVLGEEGIFSLPASESPDGREYYFRVKKIWADKSGVVFQPLNKSFVFKDFLNSGESMVVGNSILKGEAATTYSLMAINNTAIWLSDNKTAASNEYRALAKAAAASLSENFYLVTPQNVKNSVNVNSFTTFCCDMPATVKLTFSLWYVY